MTKKRANKKDEKQAKRAKKEVEKTEWELAIEDLAHAVSDEVNRFPEGAVFATLAPKIFSILKEDRNKTINALIEHFSSGIAEARVNLLKYQENAETEVNKFDDYKQDKFLETQELEKKVLEFKEKIEVLKQEKEVAENELEKALTEKVEEENRFAKDQENYDSLEGIKTKMETIRDEHCHKYLTTTASSKEQERAKKAWGELLKMELWSAETTLLSSTAKHALFKDVSDRTEFEQYALKYLFDKFDATSEIIAKKMKEEKPDDAEQTRLREVHDEKTAALDKIQSSLNDNMNELKDTEKTYDKHLKELKKLPELLEQKKEGLGGIQETIDNFAKNVESNFHKLVERTEFIPEIEEMQEDMKVEIEPVQEAVDMQVSSNFEEHAEVVVEEQADLIAEEPSAVIAEEPEPIVQEYQHQEMHYYQTEELVAEEQQMPTEYEQVEKMGKIPEMDVEMQLDASQSGPLDTHEAAVAR